MEYKMTYELFVEMIIQNIGDYLPDRLKGAEIVHQQLNRINCKRDCISFVKTQEKVRTVHPNLYLDSFYKKYQNGWELKEVLEDIGNELKKAVKEIEAINEKIQPDNIRENVFCKFINTEQNEELLKKMPHRNFHDLSIVYAWYMGEQNNAMLSAPINHELAASKGLSEEELFQLAKENTRRLFPTTIRPMSAVIDELMGGKEKKDGELFEFAPDEEFPMYVVSNSNRCFGATAVLYEDGMQMLADRLDDNLYLIPSSIHEWIVVPENFTNLENLSEIVHEVNFSQVDVEERLSNEVYHYDKRTRQFTIATDVPDKRLGDHVAEERPVYQAALLCR